jgi:hypothetical protein
LVVKEAGYYIAARRCDGGDDHADGSNDRSAYPLGYSTPTTAGFDITKMIHLCLAQ